MANFAAIYSVGQSIANYLTRSYAVAVFPPGIRKPQCSFSVVSSNHLQTEADPAPGTVSVIIYLYRVSVDAHLRNVGRLERPNAQPNPLSVALHYLVSFWAQSADDEHILAGWTMQQVHAQPLLDNTLLTSEAAWNVEDIVHVIPEELSNEELARIWDALRPDFRLSLGYLARVVRIDQELLPDSPPVVATRFNYAAPNGSP